MAAQDMTEATTSALATKQTLPRSLASSGSRKTMSQDWSLERKLATNETMWGTYQKALQERTSQNLRSN